MKRKIIYALLATLVAVGLWLYVVTVVNPEWSDTFYNIPVVLENEEVLIERGLMLTSKDIPTVTLRLSGNRTDMIKLNASNITLKADLSRIYSAGEQSLGYSIVYPGDVPSNAFQIISQTPQQITLSVSEWKSKEVDVKPNLIGAVPEQYIVFKDKVTLDHEKIIITGPSAVVDKIAMAKVTVDLNGQTSTISQHFDYELCDENGEAVEDDSLIKTNVSQVLCTVKIQQWKDIELRLDVVDGGGLTKEDCTISIDPLTIRVAGSAQQLEDLDYLVLKTVRLDELYAGFFETCTISLPEGVTSLDEKSEAKVTVSIPELPTREIKVENIEAINLPSGMTAQLGGVSKTITLRGPQNKLDAIKPENLKIQVDFSGAALGTNVYPVIVVIDAEFADDVGAMSSTEIAATVVAVES